jgi:formylglycine-generating enzyme required for sulfatase activity
MVRVPAPDGTTYCIDSTEVTNEQYARFLLFRESSPLWLTADTTHCLWNTTYRPSSGWPATGKENHPVAYVDWCDAYDYCWWAGKRLCGKIGGGQVAGPDYADTTKSEWFNSCSKGGTLTYPYGSTPSDTACNGQADGAGATVPVASKDTCEGGFPGLFDMSGNVSEWEDSCLEYPTSPTAPAPTGKSGICRVRGGSFDDTSSFLSCSGNEFDIRNRDVAVDRLGFRCCSAPF